MEESASARWENTREVDFQENFQNRDKSDMV
jgi:hypothetical protein